jgi:drug/metabolite transporter (DMT)-like permease
MSQLRYFTTLVFSTFFMGSSFIASKILLREVPPFTLVGYRFILAALVMSPLMILTSQRDTIGWNKRNVPLAMVVGLLQTASTMGLLFVSMQYISAANAAILLATNPIWVAVINTIFFKEKLNTYQIIGFLLGITGVALAIGTVNVSGELRGTLLCTLGAFCWSLATTVAQRAKIPMNPWKLNFTQMLTGGIVLVFFSFLSGEKYDFHPTTAQVGWFLWLAIPSSVGSFGLWFLALQQRGATISSSYLFLAPMFTVLLSPLVFNTPLTIVQIIGFLCIASGIYLINRKN